MLVLQTLALCLRTPCSATVGRRDVSHVKSSHLAARQWGGETYRMSTAHTLQRDSGEDRRIACQELTPCSATVGRTDVSHVKSTHLAVGRRDVSHVKSSHLAARQWGGETYRVSRAHTLQLGRGEERRIAYQELTPCSATVGRRDVSRIKSTYTRNAFPACAAPVHTWRITRANESTLCQSDFCPFANQG